MGLLLLSITTVNAQGKSAFEGIIVYDISFKGSGLPPEAITMLSGSTITIYSKGKMRREDMKTPVAVSSSILDEKNKTVISLMDIVGKKYKVKMGENELKKEEENMPASTIKYSDETKTIAGYTCKKAEMTVKVIPMETEETVTIFYTEELFYSDFRPAYKGLKGLPMEYTMMKDGIKMTLTASKVSKEPVSDATFAIPAGYTETTLEELQKNMGGQ